MVDRNLEVRSGADLSPHDRGERPYTFDRALGDLRDIGAVNFRAIARVIPPSLKPPVLEEVRQRTGEHIFSALVRGQFRDLDGALELMDRIDLRVVLPEPTVERINDLLPRTSEQSLVSVSLTQDGTGPNPENIEKARRKLRAQGFPDQDLTEGGVTEILRLRHILMELHRRNARRIEGDTLLPQLLAPIDDSNP